MTADCDCENGTVHWSAFMRSGVCADCATVYVSCVRSNRRGLESRTIEAFSVCTYLAHARVNDQWITGGEA